jgi:glycosyltransferase involved in cell wall biosynthesis
MANFAKRFIKNLLPQQILLSLILLLQNIFKKEHKVNASENIIDHLQVRRNTVIIVSGECYTPSHIYRVERYLKSYYDLGISGQWITPESLASALHLLDYCKLLILWRCIYDDQIAQVIQKANILNIKIGFDIDDYLFEPKIANPSNLDWLRTTKTKDTKIKNKTSLFKKSLLHADFGCCPTSTLVTAMEELGRKAYHLPNGYDDKMLDISRTLYKEKCRQKRVEVIRIGYAGGTMSHQKDFAVVSPALVRILEKYPQTLLVIFGYNTMLNEYPELIPFHNRIENRQRVPYSELQQEINRFDINLAPLEINPYCEAKSELKYFEAALLQIPTIASPTKVFKQCINNGLNGFIAETSDEWYEVMSLLITDDSLRLKIGQQAFIHILYYYSPEQRIHLLFQLLHSNQLDTLFSLTHYLIRKKALVYSSKNTNKYQIQHPLPIREIEHELVFNNETSGISRVGVLMVITNHFNQLEESLESISKQSFYPVDLVIIDNSSTDGSSEIAYNWLLKNKNCFSNCSLVRCKNPEASGDLKNLGFLKLDTVYCLFCTPEYILLPELLGECFMTINNSGASLIYPLIRIIDSSEQTESDKDQITNQYPWNPEQIPISADIEPLALISKASWSKIGGYDINLNSPSDIRQMFLQFVENGFFGLQITKVLVQKRKKIDQKIRL